MTARILIVDDDLDFAESLALALGGDDLAVDVAHSGEEALERFHERSYDFCFMDVRLPRRTGVEWIPDIRRIDPDVKLILMTGFSNDDLLEEGFELGAIRALRKPFSPELLLKIVKGRQMVVLVVDDEEDYLEEIAAALASRDMVALVATGGAEAVEIARTHEIDAILLDLRMSPIDGIAALAALQQERLSVPAIVVTGYLDEYREALGRARFPLVETLRKPASPSTIFRVLSDIERRRHESM